MNSQWFVRCGLNYPAVWCFAFFWTFFLGASLGSFMNVCIWRIPRGESLSKASSHCCTCGHPIAWYDNLPVISYLVLHGRCRHCGSGYSPRYMIVELLCGVLFAGSLLLYGKSGSPMGMVPLAWTMILIAVACGWIDAVHRIIPDKLTFSGALFAVLFALIFPDAVGAPTRLHALLFVLLRGAIPGGILALFALIGKWLCRCEVLGWGDVKYVALCGMLLGLPGAFFTLLFGSFSGALSGIIGKMVHCRLVRRGAIPFGPFLAAGSILWIFGGAFLMRLFWQLAKIQ